MLKNIIKRYIENKERAELIPFNVKGKVEIWGLRDGKVFHYDEGHNTVTLWAKHSNIHIISGETYSTHGDELNVEYDEEESDYDDVENTTIFSKRDISSAGHTPERNIDGTLLSGETYLSNNETYHSGTNYLYPNLSNLNSIESDGKDGKVFPYFPTKMLFGTGKEYKSWEDIPERFRDTDSSGDNWERSYANSSNGDWTEDDFNSHIDHPLNYYSAEYDEENKKLFQKRTVNDVYSGPLREIIEETEYGIEGAIKNSLYHDKTNDSDKLDSPDEYDNYFASKIYKGIGRPSFIYCNRSGRYVEDGAGVVITRGENEETENIETRVTFTAILPQQRSVEDADASGSYYPHNGHLLKKLGLFCDAIPTIKNEIPKLEIDGVVSEEDAEPGVYELLQKMPAGIMWAKRNISPIWKAHDVEIIARWTLYYS